MVGWALLLFGRMQRLFFFRKKISFFSTLLFISFHRALSAQALRGPRVEPRSVNVCAKLAGFSFFYDISSLSLLSFLHFSSFHLQPEDPKLSQKIILEKRRNMREILKKNCFRVVRYLCDHGDFFELR